MRHRVELRGRSKFGASGKRSGVTADWIGKDDLSKGAKRQKNLSVGVRALCLPSLTPHQHNRAECNPLTNENEIPVKPGVVLRLGRQICIPGDLL